MQTPATPPAAGGGGISTLRPSVAAPSLAIDASTDYAKLLAELRARPDTLSARDALSLAAVLQRCQHAATQRDEYRQHYALDIASEEGMQRLRTIWLQRATSDVQRAAVTVITPRLLPYVCRGLIDAPASDAEVTSAFARAAALGDLRARVWMTDAAIWDRSGDATWLPDNARATATDSRSFASATEAERRELMAALWTGDAAAIRMAGEILSRATMEAHWQLRETGIDVSRHADEIWHLAACSFGFDCTGDSSELAYACATAGHCAADYPAYLREFAVTPAQFAQIEAAAQEIVAAINARTPAPLLRVSGPGALVTVGRQMTVVRTR